MGLLVNAGRMAVTKSDRFLISGSPLLFYGAVVLLLRLASF
jgi:hypothetical protein